MQDSSLNHLPHTQSFVTVRCTLFEMVSSDLIGITYFLWKLMTKGEKLEQRYDHGISCTTKYIFHGGRSKMDMDKGATLKEKMWIKILGQKGSTQVGGASS